MVGSIGSNYKIMRTNERQISLATGTLQVRVQASAFALDALCGFAARANEKRGFLFLSKVLGKHWPATPSAMREIHAFLAARLALGASPCVFIALAETATGLGQGVFEAAKQRWPSSEALFIHSTRYRIEGHQALSFQEAHCHAPEQLLYLPTEPKLRRMFQCARELVLIDDEITTGNTLCNVVEAYQRINPHLERVFFLSIANFSGPDLEQHCSQRLGLAVDGIAALHGRFWFTPDSAYRFPEHAPPAVGDNRLARTDLALDLGRLGTDRLLRLPPAQIAALARGLRQDDLVLVLGTGEFMHLAFCVGEALEALGLRVFVQSTTRSPLLIGADVEQRLVFADNYREGIANYLYNAVPEAYARIILCHETPRAGLASLRQRLGRDHLCYTPRLNTLA